MAFDSVFSGMWMFDTNPDTSTSPISDFWRWNESGLIVTEIAVHNNDEDDVDRGDDLRSLEIGDRLHLRNTATADNWAMFELTEILDITTWHRLGVVVLGTGLVPGLPKTRQRVLFDFFRPAVETTGAVATRYDDILARTAALLHVPADDVWLAAAVDSAVEYTIMKTERHEIGLPDTPLIVNGLIIFAQRLYLDSPNGVQVSAGDPQFEPIYQPEHLWRHVRHYFDHLDVAYGVA